MPARHTFFFLVLVSLLAAPVAAEKPDPEAERRAKADAAALIQEMTDKSSEQRYAAIQEAAGKTHASLTVPLLRRLKDDNEGVRMAAIRALARREGKERKKAALGLAGRIGPLSKKAEHQKELIAVADALHDLAQKVTIKALLDGIKTDTPKEVADKRIRAVANVPHASAIEALIVFASKGRKNTTYRRAATNALRYATGEKLGHDPDKWRAWWKQVRKDFDFKAAAERRAEEAVRQAEREERRKSRGEGKGKRRGKGGKKKDAGDAA